MSIANTDPRTQENEKYKDPEDDNTVQDEQENQGSDTEVEEDDIAGDLAGNASGNEEAEEA